MRTRVITLLLALILLISLLPVAAVSAAGDAMPDAEVRELLNNAELYPQRTGYPELDALMRGILEDCEEEDTYTKVKTAYDWVVQNVKYSWKPYSQNYAPAYDCFNVDHHLYYEVGLEEAVPAEIANRAYHAMKVKEGVCYDYAAAFALLVRYIGIDAFVHTGIFLLETSSQTPCHHGWTEVLIDGEYYVFDPQREYRLCNSGYSPIKNYYFGVKSEDAWRYPQPETEINAARDAGFLPVAAVRRQTVSVVAKATASGETTGTDYYMTGDKATVTVTPTGDNAFLGWYDEAGQFLSESTSYTFTVTKDTMVIAVFEKEYFIDVPKGEWYYKDANEAGERWIINGIRPFVFGAAEPITRAMAVTILARAVQGEMTSGATGFTDVPEDEWYAQAVNWGVSTGVVQGMTPTEFAPADYVTREQFISLVMRVVDNLEKTPELTELEYTDVEDISEYALEHMEAAQTIGLLSGYEDGSVRPQSNLNRAEGVALVMRLLRWLEM